MNSKRRLQDIEDIKALANRLSRCPDVTRLDMGEDKEAWTLAHAFEHLEESFQKFLQDHLAKLTDDAVSESELRDILLEIGDEFRHILYHIHDPKFYRYLP